MRSQTHSILSKLKILHLTDVTPNNRIKDAQFENKAVPLSYINGFSA